MCDWDPSHGYYFNELKLTSNTYNYLRNEVRDNILYTVSLCIVLVVCVWSLLKQLTNLNAWVNLSLRDAYGVLGDDGHDMAAAGTRGRWWVLAVRLKVVMDGDGDEDAGDDIIGVLW